jgi:NAD/NADP transhydrogenase alpha subunit
VEEQRATGLAERQVSELIQDHRRGKVPPAKVFIISVGVAGLAAIGAASGLGAPAFL